MNLFQFSLIYTLIRLAYLYSYQMTARALYSSHYHGEYKYWCLNTHFVLNNIIITLRWTPLLWTLTMVACGWAQNVYWANHNNLPTSNSSSYQFRITRIVLLFSGLSIYTDIIDLNIILSTYLNTYSTGIDFRRYSIWRLFLTFKVDP